MSNSYPLLIPSQHPSFPDHFPGDPIVPGALLLDWIIQSMKKENPEIDIIEVKSIKFLTTIKPSAMLTIEYTKNRDKNQIISKGYIDNQRAVDCRLIFKLKEDNT